MHLWYSGTFRNIQPCSDILSYIKAYWDMFRHYYWCIWSHNQTYAELCVTLAYATVPYSEPCRIYENLFTTLTCLKPDTYLEPCKRFKVKFLEKIAKNYNYFSKAFHPRSLTGFWIGLSLSKYSSTCRVISRYVLYDIYPEPWLLL